MRNRAFALLVVALLLGACSGTGRQPDDGEIGSIGEPRQGTRRGNIYADLGFAYFRQGQYDVALQKCNQGLELDPNNANLHNVLGIIYERLGEYELARKNFEAALDIDPYNPYILNAFGSFLCARERYSESLEQFQKAVNNPLYRTPWVALTNAGSCAMEIPDKAMAEDLFRKALQGNPKFPQVLLRMAGLSLEKKNYLSARAYLQRYLEVAEHTPDSLWIGIQTERKLGDHDTVATYELLLRSKFPDSKQAAMLLETLGPSQR
jgi:type IV pilus assembly protein PilF